MCCFSVATPVGLIARLFRPKVHVSRTTIFARALGDGRQALAYGMDLRTRTEVAMVLPLPVAPGSGEDAVRFVDLSKWPRMFDELRTLFEFEQTLGAKKGGFRLPASQAPKLVVHDIGSFVASYVPARADFARLDEQFRLPAVLFDAVPHYADYGFAVFQLKPGDVTVHPMALTFPSRAPDKLFFPTVHVHDGAFHAKAKFDHALYYQHPTCPEPDRSVLPFSAFRGDAVGWMKPSSAYADLVDAARSIVRRTLRARLPNEDTWIEGS
jgi:hypothetical protein